MKVLVTGGAGYIGSHTCLQLLLEGHVVCVLDSLANGNFEALNQVEKLSSQKLSFKKVDIRDFTAMSHVFTEFKPDVVVHFAGLKAVGESVRNPSLYYEVNVDGTSNVLDAMALSNCNSIIFSSSATIYGIPIRLPCDEQHPIQPINPYGETKVLCEKLIHNWVVSKFGRKAVSLRYFNPVGAHPSGLIGEDPKCIPNNLMPFLSQVAIGNQPCLKIFGSDYSTIDGTGVRDYVHVVDLARAHLAAIENISDLEPFEAINVGTGRGISVLELVNEFENHCGFKIPIELSARRLGDAPEVWAAVDSAVAKLKFQTQYGLHEMCRDSWLWQKTHRYGFSMSP